MVFFLLPLLPRKNSDEFTHPLGQVQGASWVVTCSLENAKCRLIIKILSTTQLDRIGLAPHRPCRSSWRGKPLQERTVRQVGKVCTSLGEPLRAWGECEGEENKARGQKRPGWERGGFGPERVYSSQETNKTSKLNCIALLSWKSSSGSR